MRLINADAAWNVFEEAAWWNNADKDEAQDLLDRVPTIDAEPVRHGRWIRMDDTFTKWQCSACGVKYHDICWPYCPNCGTKMDGGIHNAT